MTRDELTALALPREVSDRILADIESHDDSESDWQEITGHSPHARRPKPRFALNGGESTWDESKGGLR